MDEDRILEFAIAERRPASRGKKWSGENGRYIKSTTMNGTGRCVLESLKVQLGGAGSGGEFGLGISPDDRC